MIRPLRRRHAVMLIVLAALVVPLYLLALSQRPPRAIASLPSVLESPPAATDAVPLTVEGPAAGIGLSILVGGSEVEVRLQEALHRPAVSLFCVFPAAAENPLELPGPEYVEVGRVQQGRLVQRRIRCALRREIAANQTYFTYLPRAGSSEIGRRDCVAYVAKQRMRSSVPDPTQGQMRTECPPFPWKTLSAHPLLYPGL